MSGAKIYGDVDPAFAREWMQQQSRRQQSESRSSSSAAPTSTIEVTLDGSGNGTTGTLGQVRTWRLVDIDGPGHVYRVTGGTGLSLQVSGGTPSTTLTITVELL